MASTSQRLALANLAQIGLSFGAGLNPSNQVASQLGGINQELIMSLNLKRQQEKVQEKERTARHKKLVIAIAGTLIGAGMGGLGAAGGIGGIGSTTAGGLGSGTLGSMFSGGASTIGGGMLQGASMGSGLFGGGGGGLSKMADLIGPSTTPTPPVAFQPIQRRTLTLQGPQF